MTSFFTIVAIIVGPIFAVQAQKWIERATAKKAKQREIFATLMSTRGLRMVYAHVQSLNMIDIYFHGEKKVIDTWEAYRDHLYTYPSNTTESNYDAEQSAWGREQENKIANLLSEMGKFLKYEFSETNLKRGAYTPQGYGTTEEEIHIIRKNLSQMFAGKTPFPVIPVTIINTPSSPTAAQESDSPPDNTLPA